MPVGGEKESQGFAVESWLVVCVHEIDSKTHLDPNSTLQLVRVRFLCSLRECVGISPPVWDPFWKIIGKIIIKKLSTFFIIKQNNHDNYYFTKHLLVLLFTFSLQLFRLERMLATLVLYSLALQ